ncbi:MAG: hypothetical protein DDT34_01931 [Firmicutes bacterium]|nr:hypothetical protein [Bacillota bacterium]
MLFDASNNTARGLQYAGLCRLLHRRSYLQLALRKTLCKVEYIPEASRHNGLKDTCHALPIAQFFAFLMGIGIHDKLTIVDAVFPVLV